MMTNSKLVWAQQTDFFSSASKTTHFPIGLIDKDFSYLWCYNWESHSHQFSYTSFRDSWCLTIWATSAAATNWSWMLLLFPSLLQTQANCNSLAWITIPSDQANNVYYCGAYLTTFYTATAANNMAVSGTVRRKQRFVFCNFFPEKYLCNPFQPDQT